LQALLVFNFVFFEGKDLLHFSASVNVHHLFLRLGFVFLFTVVGVAGGRLLVELGDDSVLHIALTEQSFSDELKLEIVHLGVEAFTNIQFLVAGVHDGLIVDEADLAELLQDFTGSLNVSRKHGSTVLGKEVVDHEDLLDNLHSSGLSLEEGIEHKSVSLSSAL